MSVRNYCISIHPASKPVQQIVPNSRNIIAEELTSAQARDPAVGRIIEWKKSNHKLSLRERKRESYDI